MNTHRREALPIGFGNVGQEVPEVASRNLGLDIHPVVARHDGLWDQTAYLTTRDGITRLRAAGEDDPDLRRNARLVGDDLIAYLDYSGAYERIETAFMATPSSSDGQEMLDLTRGLVERGIFVAMANKDVAARQLRVIRDEGLDEMVGFRATLGGNTGMLPMLTSQDPRNIKEVQAVVNGTLNFVMSEVDGGSTVEQAAEDAADKGYTEPGAEDTLDILNGEVEDHRLKIVIATNVGGLAVGSDTLLVPTDLEMPEVTDEDVDFLESRDGRGLRYFVSMYRTRYEIPEDPDARALFLHNHEGLFIVGGFRNPNLIGKARDRVRGLNGIENSMTILTYDGQNPSIRGAGAGGRETARSMVKDVGLHRRGVTPYASTKISVDV